MHNLQLHIPTPCHENWDAMRLEERGRFCAVCTKVVRDFSGMDTAEVLQVVAAAPEGSICGRVRTSQLAVPTQVRPARTSPTQAPVPVRAQPLSAGLRRFLVALLISFGPGALSLSAASTQELQHVLTTQVEENATISGRVADQRTGRLLRDIEVRLMRGKQVISTGKVDAQGNFELELPSNKRKRRPYRLVLAYKGQDVATYTVAGRANGILLVLNRERLGTWIPCVDPGWERERRYTLGALTVIQEWNFSHSLFDQNTMMDQMLLGR
jgi:hypothetical protein